MKVNSVTNFVELFNQVNQLVLESGDKLDRVKIAYQTYGNLNSDGTNAVLICHALTGNAHAAGVLNNEETDTDSQPDLLKKYSQMFKGKPGWWDELIGPGKVFDTDKYYVICSNILGSCYGTTGPVSLNPKTNKPYQADFPRITVRDIVKVQRQLIDYLKVKKLITVAGGSLGGMQALEWGIMYPDKVKSIIPIASSAKHSAWAIGIGEAERLAIKNDPQWNNGFYKTQPFKGLSLARQIAMISYRSFQSFEMKYGRHKTEDEKKYLVESYLDYQGKKLVERFDANTYLLLTDVMDKHDISFKRDRIDSVLNQINVRTLVVGISSDILYPTAEQKFLVDNIPGAQYAEINSPHGHDAFLIEFDQLSKIIGIFLSELDET